MLRDGHVSPLSVRGLYKRVLSEKQPTQNSLFIGIYIELPDEVDTATDKIIKWQCGGR
jgi:hypothetical protein